MFECRLCIEYSFSDPFTLLKQRSLLDTRYDFSNTAKIKSHLSMHYDVKYRSFHFPVHAGKYASDDGIASIDILLQSRHKVIGSGSTNSFLFHRYNKS
jgi:hypothetical protein